MKIVLVFLIVLILFSLTGFNVYAVGEITVPSLSHAYTLLEYKENVMDYPFNIPVMTGEIKFIESLMEHNLKQSIGEKPINPISISIQKLNNDDSKISITDIQLIYGNKETIKITITNNNTEKVIFNFSLIDPVGREFKDESCVDYDKTNYFILPNSFKEIIWDLKSCINGIIADDWKFSSYLTSDGQLTNLVTSVEINIVENIDYYFPEYVEPSTSIESLAFENIAASSKHGEFIIPYKITGGILDTISISGKHWGSFNLDLRMPENGTLVIKVPKKIIGNSEVVIFVSDKREDSSYIYKSKLELTTKNMPEYRIFTISVPEKIFKINLEFLRSFNQENFDYEDYDKIFSPYQQNKNGVKSNDIICKNNHQLVLKSSNNFAACVHIDSVSVLLERGWAKQLFSEIVLNDLIIEPVPQHGTYKLQTNNGDLLYLRYSITNAKISTMVLDEIKNSLSVRFEPEHSQGIFTITIPSSIFGVEYFSSFSDLQIISDEKEIEFDETNKISERTLSFVLNENIKEIKIKNSSLSNDSLY